MTNTDTLWGHRVRGLVLGLALGDALGHLDGAPPATGLLRTGVSTQLAAFSTEGLIRAMVRGHHKGLTDISGVVWHAYNRWAVLQGIEAAELRRRWSMESNDPWPDGWLSRVPLLTQRRGSAPATVAAVVGLTPGTLDSPVSQSAGAHALTRLLPAAAFGQAWERDSLVREVEACAALTHGEPDAHWAASTGVLWIAECLSGKSMVDGLLNTGRIEMINSIGFAHDMYVDEPRSPQMLKRVLAQVGPPATAVAALAGAVYVTHSFPDPHEAVDAVRFASAASSGASVAVVTAAVLGATHGVDVWPVELVSRLELAWVLDTLARDLVLQVSDNPGGGEYEEPRDPGWWERYPGW